MFSSFTGSDFHAVESFPGDMSFGELSLIKSQSHLRSHIRIDQFSCGWNCSWPLVPWALIQNQQHSHRGLKQLNWVRLQEAGKTTEGKYPIKQCQLAASRVSFSFLMSWWVTYSFVYAINVNDKGYSAENGEKKKEQRWCSCQNSNQCPVQRCLWSKIGLKSIWQKVATRWSCSWHWSNKPKLRLSEIKSKTCHVQL